MDLFRQFVETGEPRLHIEAVPLTERDVPPAHRLIRLDGARMTSLDALYNELVEAFQLPEYFGRNFNALSECLADLDWFPADGYLVEIRNSACLLTNEPDDVLDGFLNILDRVSGSWAEPVAEDAPRDRGARPFHVVFIADTETSIERLRRGGFIGNASRGSSEAQ